MNTHDKRLAAVWWRVSTDDQREASPDTQIQEAVALAQQEGYHVPEEYILGTDWHSLTVWECPPMERLKELIRNRTIHAIFMYDADRGPSKPVHRLLFRAMCQEYGVRIRCCHGQVPDGDMGEVMEFLSAWSKEKQVYRAQQGARDGLRDRAALRGLPPTSAAPYGYRWNGSQFEPDSTTAPIARRIWDMALEGVPLRHIARTLTRAGIPSPAGRPRWSTSTLARILSDPAYKGEYVALRTQRVEPKMRLGATYGKSTHRPRDARDHIPLPGLVSEALVTAEEYARVQERLARNRAQGGKVVQAYLLRGMIRCEICGRHCRGKLQRYRDRTYYHYVCNGAERRVDGTRCPLCSINGPSLEARIWDRVVSFLTNPEVFLTAVEDQRRGHREMVQQIDASIRRLEKRLGRIGDAEAKALSEHVRKMASEEAYKRVAAELRAERVWVSEELERQRKALDDAQNMVVSVDAIKALYPALVARIQRATFEDKRFVLECLDAQVTVGPSGVSLSLAVPESALAAVSTTPGRAGRE